jgi:hypothetical protein
MKRVLFLLAAVALIAAACSDSSTDPPAPTSPEASSTTVPSTVSTTTHPPVTTTTAPPPTATPTAPPPPPSTGSVVARRLGIGDEYYPDLGNPDYDVQHYQLDITFDPIANHLEAVATITAVATDRFRTFNLDFDQLTVDAIRVDGATVEFVHADEELTILPAQPIAPGTEFVIEVEYSGNPVPAPTDAIAFNTGWFTSSDGSEAFVVAEPDNAHTWFPSNDHPLDKATFLFNLTVPEEIIAAANGTLVSTTPADDGMATWQWRMDDPMATYLATVVIGEFDLVVDESASLDAGFPIRHVLPRGTTISDWPGLERQGEMLAFLADLFGPYPFDNYGIAIVDGFQNADASPTRSSSSVYWCTNLPTSGSATVSAPACGVTSGSTKASPPTPSGCGSKASAAATSWRPTSRTSGPSSPRTVPVRPGILLPRTCSISRSTALER